MMRYSRLFVLLAGTLVLGQTGCVLINGGSRVWTPVVTEKLPIDTENLRALEVRTHNGTIAFDGQPAGTPDAYVTVSKKAGGRSREDAEEALAALNVFVESAGDGTQRIGWKWNGIKRRGWIAAVSFDVHAPEDVRFDAQTHNGAITIQGAASDVHVQTHNGRVEVNSKAGKLYAKTHNGGITAHYDGRDVTLVTHNGHVTADLNRCGAIGGRIQTHNGSVDVIVGERTSARLECRSYNGGIRCDVPLQDTLVKRRRLSGTMGSGEGKLDVTTHNGRIRIKSSAG